ncbi:MAG: polysaccharide deacetylase family protein [Nitrospira sp.]|nr:polysaccharide deacetylase family protein [Nitrospira sp.]
MKIVGRVKHAIKLVVVYGLYGFGLLQLWQRIVLRKRAVVLMYHRVLTEQEMAVTGSHPAIVVKRDTFAAQMEMLRKRFNVITIDEFVERMERKIPFENSSCLVTFDDGWQDNYYNAFPILTRHRIPAVVFLPVNFIGGTRLFWQERLTYLILQAMKEIKRDPTRRDQLARFLAPLDLESILDTSSHDPCLVVMDAVRRNKTFDSVLMKNTLEKLAEALNVPPERYQETDGFLNWEQVSSMAKQGIAFGGHGAEHRILTNISLSEAEQEICTAQETLDSQLQVRVPTFSYPNGNWSLEIAKLVEKVGFRAAFTTVPGHVQCDHNRFAIHRVNIHDGVVNSEPMFLARILGLF